MAEKRKKTYPTPPDTKIYTKPEGLMDDRLKGEEEASGSSGSQAVQQHVSVQQDGTQEPAPEQDEQGAQQAGQSEETREFGPQGLEPSDQENWFPVVGVGASAGGLDALEAMFSAGDDSCDMAFVVVTHTGQKQVSMLPELLARKTSLKVVEAADDMALAPGKVFVHPTDRDVVLQGGRLRLVEREKSGGLHLPVDRLFESLARELHERCAVVVLSGTGTDGTRSLSTVKEQDGLILAQEPESAKYSGMPASAIRTGLVDDVVDVKEMCRMLSDYFATLTSLVAKGDRERREVIGRQEMETILSLLKSRTGRDFTSYKKNTLIRRIQRRMAVTRSDSPKKYILTLKQDKDEVDNLLQELLIGVTSFFRDPETFEHLRRKVLPDLVRRVEDSEQLRVWVPGCASGEEAYSLAMLLAETVQELEANMEYQVFATDIDQQALQRARQGLYPRAIAKDVSPERLKRFFTEQESGFQVRKEIRDHIVFAVQDVLKDPPFTRLHLVACRNLLIYLESRAQKKLIPLFHYVLNPGGVLFLGTSESVGEFSQLFAPINQKWNIFRRREVKAGLRPEVAFPSGRAAGKPPVVEPEQAGAEQNPPRPRLEEAVREVMLTAHTPPAIIVDEQGEIAYFHGRTGKYLEHSQGRPSANLHALAREGLRFELSSCLRRAVKSGEEVTRENLWVRTNGGRQHLALRVEPLSGPEPLRDMYLVLFLDRPEPEAEEAPPPKVDVSDLEDEAREQMQDMEKALRDCRREMRTLQEELESTTEELRSSNEELQSSNEELQSTNEELESSREELQSLNEELSTVNSELEEKMDQLSRAYENVTALFNSTRIPILFLDREQRLKRFTGAAKDLVHVMDTDIGRPITHLAAEFPDLDIAATAHRVLETLDPVEREVATTTGDWYLMRVLPTRNEDQRISGTVVTFLNINAQKEAQEKIKALHQDKVEASRRYAENVVDTVRDALLVLDERNLVISANRSFYRMFETSEEETAGRHLTDLGGGQWDIPRLRELLRKVRRTNEPFEDYMVEHDFPAIGYRTMLLNARRLHREDVGEERILLAMEDVTGKRKPGAEKDEG